MSEIIKPVHEQDTLAGYETAEFNPNNLIQVPIRSRAKAVAAVRVLTARVSAVSLAITLIVLIGWMVAPSVSFRLMQDNWIVMSPRIATGFFLLSCAFLIRSLWSTSSMSRLVLVVVGGLVAVLSLNAFFFYPIPATESPFSLVALFALSVALIGSWLVGPKRSVAGDVLGATVLFLIVTFIYFLICYCHGVRCLLECTIPCPRLLSVTCSVLLSAGTLGLLGAEHFPIRPFVGSSVRSALLRKSLPAAIAVVLVFVCVKGSMPGVLSPPLASFLTLMMSSVIVIYLVIRSSSVVGLELEKALQESEQNYSNLARGLKDHAVFLLSTEGDILVWNQGAELLTGYTAVEVLGTPVSRLFGLHGPGLILGDAIDQVRSTGIYRHEGAASRKDGSPFWAETSLSRMENSERNMVGVSVIIRDATERRQAEDSMKKALQEKEVLLKEIHHRVKNNLQVISSLLRLQAETVEDKGTADLFLDSQERVRAMAMIHEYLYKSPDLARINFPIYVASLVRNLYRAFGLASSPYAPNVQVDDVHLSLDIAAPCGLLLTELVSNAAKYAYPGKNGGPVDIRFRDLKNGMLELSVADQGVGFPEGFDWMKSDSLGLRLIRLLTEQLQGTVSLEKNGGIKFIVTFHGDGP